MMVRTGQNNRKKNLENPSDNLAAENVMSFMFANIQGFKLHKANKILLIRGLLTERNTVHLIGTIDCPSIWYLTYAL